ncbi:MAG TPA: DUF202 domain-containing protein, partial [Micromonosporaceae bacterium]|nr:DUF202 domain-containing protein [Micromonosporaceae bacterium]
MTKVPTGGQRGPMWSGADGASAERTRLAWRRTALASTAVVLLTVRLATRDSFTVLGAIAVAAALLLWLAQMWLTQQRIHAIDRHEPTEVMRALPA